MIFYRYDEKDKTLNIKITILIDNFPRKPNEEELREILPEILERYVNRVKNKSERIYDNNKWNLL